MKKILNSLFKTSRNLSAFILPKLVFAFGSGYAGGIKAIQDADTAGTQITQWAARIGIIIGFVLGGLAVYYAPGEGIVKWLFRLVVGGIMMWVGFNYAPSFFGYVLVH